VDVVVVGPPEVVVLKMRGSKCEQCCDARSKGNKTHVVPVVPVPRTTISLKPMFEVVELTEPTVKRRLVVVRCGIETA
jgi:hypothetical protein